MNEYLFLYKHLIGFRLASFVFLFFHVFLFQAKDEKLFHKY